VEVPQTYAAYIPRGMRAELKLPENPRDTFPATVTDTSQAISETSRTLLVELEADNKQGALLPGAYAEVHFSITGASGTVRIPTSALLFQQHGLQVAVVGADNKAHLKSIELGRDLGTEVEVIKGLSPSDRVIDSPPDSIAESGVVEIADNSRTDTAAKNGKT
jgi:multidrug efflux pump subunit AcrA (membrane-fusion protein)